MTKAQNALYWREWSRVRKAKPDADRHALHVAALGDDKSHKDFTNEDFDRVLAEFRAISQPANLNGQVRQIRQPEIRFEHKVAEQTDLLGTLGVPDPEAYVLAILRDKFRTTDIRDLSADRRPRWNGREMIEDSEQEMFRNTLARAISRQRQQKRWTVKELYARLACYRLAKEIQAMAPEAFVAEIMHQRFGAGRIDELDQSQLNQLRNTIAAESNRLRRAAAQPEERELETALAFDDNEPF